MLLSEALSGVEVLRRLSGEVEITGVEYDSRRVGPGSLFVAIRGENTDGNQYIEQAVANGASAVVTDSAAGFDGASASPPGVAPVEFALVQVPHGRRALATLSANVFGHPERRLAVTGVTGTNGKTTTTYLVEQLLRQAGRGVVLIGTIEYHVGREVRPAPHTTPESRDLLALFADGVCAGATEAVMEVSSHALEQDRTWAVPFDVGVFTNLTRDHLDFHGSMDAYFRAKRRLFDGSGGAPPPRVAVINADDPYGRALIEVARAAGSEVIPYGVENGDYRAEEIALQLDGMSFRLCTPGGAGEIRTKLTGRVNVYNLLAAVAAAVARGIPLESAMGGARVLAPAPGRLELVDAGQDFAVAVDYAHTDDALRKAILLARELVEAHRGRVITLFGCGGDRDRTKRPLMGRAAGEGSDVVFVTSDNPRSEDPLAIIRETRNGLEAAAASRPFSWMEEPDRARAIALAIQEARPGDFVLIAGKGHEKTQTAAGRVQPFDDVAEARRALSARMETSKAER